MDKSYYILAYSLCYKFQEGSNDFIKYPCLYCISYSHNKNNESSIKMWLFIWSI